MKLFISIFSIPCILFIVLISISISKINIINELSNETKSLKDDLHDLYLRYETEKLLSNDLKLAKQDWEDAKSIASDQLKFWENYVAPNYNLVNNQNTLSSSQVNAEINRLLSSVSRSCSSKKVKLGHSSMLSLNPFPDTTENTKGFGFGFSAYDGFWPSFTKSEANTILVQFKIIKELIEYLLNSYDDGEILNLISIKRESAGKTDSIHIGNDLITNYPPDSLLRYDNFGQSLLFEFTFIGKTENCRSFVNQLRPPYSLRLVEVKRHEEQLISTDDYLFSPNTQHSEILPIIRDISSTFVIHIEYVYEVDSNIIDILSEELKYFANQKQISIIEDSFK